MLSSIKNWSSSVGRYSFIRATTAACLLRLRPVGRGHGLQKGLDVAALPVEVTETHRAAVTDEEDRVAAETLPAGLDVLKPLLVEAVGEKAVLAAVDLVAEEDDLLVVPRIQGLSCGDSLGPRSITVKTASSKVRLSPSAIGVFGTFAPPAIRPRTSARGSGL